MRLVLVGCGNMGFAMLEGWLEKSIVMPDDVSVVEPNDALRERAANRGVKAFATADELGADHTADIVILAVKPQVMATVALAYKTFAERGALIVSVAAGISSVTLASLLGADAAIARVMPNTPSAVGKGMMVIYTNNQTSAHQRSQTESLMAASGETATIDDESLMDAVTGVSGSGPAYVFHMIEALRDAGVTAGLPEPIADQLAMQTIYGAAAYAKHSKDTPADLRRQVTSPNGTTQAGLEVLMEPEGGLASLMRKTVAAAKKRSEELG